MSKTIKSKDNVSIPDLWREKIRSFQDPDEIAIKLSQWLLRQDKYLTVEQTDELVLPFLNLARQFKPLDVRKGEIERYQSRVKREAERNKEIIGKLVVAKGKLEDFIKYCRKNELYRKPYIEYELLEDMADEIQIGIDFYIEFKPLDEAIAPKNTGKLRDDAFIKPRAYRCYKKMDELKIDLNRQIKLR